MKKNNRKSVTNFLSYKEMMNVTGGRGDGWGPCLFDGTFCVYNNEWHPWNCDNEEDCEGLFGHPFGSCRKCPKTTV